MYRKNFLSKMLLYFYQLKAPYTEILQLRTRIMHNRYNANLLNIFNYCFIIMHFLESNIFPLSRRFLWKS